MEPNDGTNKVALRRFYSNRNTAIEPQARISSANGSKFNEIQMDNGPDRFHISGGKRAVQKY